MSKLSAIIIAKNSENIIADCLDSLSFCDEIMLVDNDSKDRTVEVAKMMNVKIRKHISQDFAELRNFGLSLVKSDWVLYIDADERVSKDLASNIKASIENKENNFSAFKLLRKNYYFGKVEWPYVEEIERLFKRKDLEKWIGKLHESPVIKGEVGKLEGYLLHYTHRDLSSMLEKTMEWSETEADLRFNANHPKMSWWRFPRVMCTAFFDSYVRQKGYKAGTAGLVESIYQSFSMFITYARLWEIQNESIDKNTTKKNI
jgi:glycosyltransferase involved in cell wall biosynthesis